MKIENGKPRRRVHKVLKVKNTSSVKHQATKALSKTLKKVRGLLVQKAVRKITQLREEAELNNNEKIENYVLEMEKLKHLDTAAIASAIIEVDLDVSSTLNLDVDGMTLISKHKHVKEFLEAWRSKFQEARDAEAKSKAAIAKQKPIKVH